MHSKDSMKEELLVLREEYRSIFLFLLATLTGTFTSFYQVLTAEAELYVLIVSVLGFTSSIFIMILIKKLRLKMDSDIQKLGELK